MKTTCLIGLILPVFLFGCGAAPTAEDVVVRSERSASEYKSTIASMTRSDERYSGFQHLYKVNVTLRTSAVEAARHERLAFFRQWTKEIYLKERSDSVRDLSLKSHVFLGYYSPNASTDQLQRKSSIWEIYLETNGQKYKGHIQKSTRKQDELIGLYPHHSRFFTPYTATFDVPMTAVEVADAKIIFASSLGQAIFNFPLSKTN